MDTPSMTSKRSILKKWWFWIFIFVVFVAVLPSCDSGDNQMKDINKLVTDSTEKCIPVDDVTTFLCRYGLPDEDYSSEVENPRPFIVIRMLTYTDEHVRVIYVPANNFSYEKWTLVRFQDPITLNEISPEEAVLRMKERDKYTR